MIEKTARPVVYWHKSGLLAAVCAALLTENLNPGH